MTSAATPLEDLFMDRAVAEARHAGVEPALQAALATLQRLAVAGRLKVALAALAAAEKGGFAQAAEQVEGEERVRWEAVESRLRALEHLYKQIGNGGRFVRDHVLRPLRQRFDAGERTRELAEAIMEVE